MIERALCTAPDVSLSGRSTASVRGQNRMGIETRVFSFRWFIVAESSVSWFVVREKYCWMVADSAE
jgi:hypothetical protein